MGDKNRTAIGHNRSNPTRFFKRLCGRDQTMTYSAVFRILRTVTHTGDDPDPLIQKLRAFAQLQAGWSYGKGRAIGADVIVTTERIYRASYRSRLQVEVFPGTNGEVILVFSRGDLSVHVT